MPFCKHIALITPQSPDSPRVKVSEVRSDLFPSLVIAVLEIASPVVCHKLASPRLAARLPVRRLGVHPLLSHGVQSQRRAPPGWGRGGPPSVGA